AAVVGHDVADARLDREAADESADAALEHLHDHAFAAAAAVHAGHAAEHAVAMHDLAHLEGRQEQVVAHAAFRPEETEALGVGDHRAGDQVGLRGGDEAAAAVLQDL